MARHFQNLGMLRNAAWLRQGNGYHQRLETDDYYSDSDCDSDLEDRQPMRGSPVRTVLRAQTAMPQDITFTVPDVLDNEGGVDVVCIQGPHGPIRVPLPEGAKLGEQCSVRLGPPAQYFVTVPEGGKPGDSATFEGANGETLTASVPAGKKPGETFEVSLPVLLIQVPPGAKAGVEVMYEAPDGQSRFARIPKGVSAGHYFPVLIVPPGRDVLIAESTWPLELTFNAPNDKTIKPGQPVCVQGPHGPIMVPLPDDVKPGQKCSVRIGPQNDSGSYDVTVPEGAEPGQPVQFQGTNGESLNAIVPEGKKVGEKFQVSMPTVMVRMPQGAQAGTEVMFQTPGEQQVRFTAVPSGLDVGMYFPVLLQGSLQKQTETKQEKVEAEETHNAVEQPDLIE